MDCRPHCGACCIAASLNQPYYGMPNGKPAGVVCVHLSPEDKRCHIWGTEYYPKACKNFQPSRDVCGDNREQALRLIKQMELDTLPQNKR